MLAMWDQLPFSFEVRREVRDGTVLGERVERSDDEQCSDARFEDHPADCHAEFEVDVV